MIKSLFYVLGLLKIIFFQDIYIHDVSFYWLSHQTVSSRRSMIKSLFYVLGLLKSIFQDIYIHDVSFCWLSHQTVSSRRSMIKSFFYVLGLLKIIFLKYLYTRCQFLMAVAPNGELPEKHDKIIFLCFGALENHFFKIFIYTMSVFDGCRTKR